MKEKPPSRWDRTFIGSQRPDAVDRMFKGRRIIGRDTPVDAGVYIGAGKREAIVVDFENDEQLQKVYERALELATTDEKFDKGRALEAVYQAVEEAIPNRDLVAVQDIVQKYDAGDDRKIQLGVFISNGAGVCRHHALAAGAILEKFIKEGLLGGTVSIDRNTVGGSGHAWARYTTSSGETVILDVMHRKLNYLENLQDSEQDWSYNRPEEEDETDGTLGHGRKDDQNLAV